MTGVVSASDLKTLPWWKSFLFTTKNMSVVELFFVHNKNMSVVDMFC